MSSNDLITNVGKNSNDTAALIWSVADDLVGAYKPHEYGLVILPMTVIKRLFTNVLKMPYRWMACCLSCDMDLNIVEWILRFAISSLNPL